MVKMNAASTLKAKETFERVAHTIRVMIKHYHCNKILFDTTLFKASITRVHQSIIFGGVNVHHQNGKAERRIKYITTGARATVLHASYRCSKAIYASLCPMALKHYVNFRNNLPSTYLTGGKDG